SEVRGPPHRTTLASRRRYQVPGLRVVGCHQGEATRSPRIHRFLAQRTESKETDHSSWCWSPAVASRPNTLTSFGWRIWPAFLPFLQLPARLRYQDEMPPLYQSSRSR